MPGGIGSGGIVDIPFPANGPIGYVLGKTALADYAFDWLAPGGGGAGVASVSAGTTQATGPQVVFSNSPTVTFGVDGNTVTASAAGGGVGNTGSISAGTTRGTLGEVVFSNSNGLSFGMNGQTMTASHNGLTSQSNQAFSAGGGSSTFQTLSFRNANGISFSNSNGSVEASYTVPVQVPFGVSAGTQSVSTGTLSFANSNGITFGMSGSSQVTASHNGLTSQSNQAVSGANGSFTFQTLSFSNANGISFGTSAGSAVTASYTVPAAQTGVSGLQVSNTTYTSGTITFQNANGISFGSSGANGISASYTVPTVPAQLSVGNSTGGNTVGDTGVFTGRVVLAGGNNITLSGSSNGGSITISISGPNVGGAQTGISGVVVSNTTYTSGTVSFSNANGISFGSSAGQAITASYTVPTVPAQLSVGNSNLGNTVGDSGVVTGRLALVGGNNITLSGSTNAGSMTITISGGAGGGAAFSAGASTAGNTAGSTGTVSNQMMFVGTGPISLSQSTAAGGATLSINGPAVSSLSATGILSISTNGSTISIGAGPMTGYAVGNTTQSSSGSFDARSMSFRGEGLISVGVTNNSIVVSGTQSNQVASAANGSFAFQTLSFSNVNGISFGTSAGSAITASHNALTSQSNQAFSAAGGSSAFQTLSFSNANGISFTNTNGQVGASYTVPGTISAYAQSNTTQSSSGTLPFNSIQFAGAGIASVGVTNGSVVISVPAGGGGGDGGVFAGVSNLGNTAGSTGTVSTGNLILVGSGAVSLSQSTGAAGSAATVTIFVAPGTATMWQPFNEGVNVAGQVGNASLHIVPLPTPAPAALGELHVNRLCIPLYYSNASNSTGTVTISGSFALYTKNASSLSLSMSTSYSTAFTFSGNNSASLYNGIRLLTVPWTITIGDGRYYVGQWTRTSTGGANATFSQMLVSQLNSNFSGILGLASTRSVQWPLGYGVYSASFSTAMPNSIAFSQIDGTASLAARPPSFFVINGTV